MATISDNFATAVAAPTLLPKTKEPADEDDREDDGRVSHVAEKDREHGGADEDENDRARELPN